MMYLPLGDCTIFCVLVLVLLWIWLLDLDLKMALTCEPLEGSWEAQGPQITLWKLQSRSFSVSLSWVCFFSCRILLLAVWAGAHHPSQVSLPAGRTCEFILTSTAASGLKVCFSKMMLSVPLGLQIECSDLSLLQSRQGCPGGSVVKNPPANEGDIGDMRLGFSPWVRKIPWRRAWQPTPVFLPGEFHAQRSLLGYSPRGSKDSDTTEAT